MPSLTWAWAHLKYWVQLIASEMLLKDPVRNEASLHQARIQCGSREFRTTRKFEISLPSPQFGGVRIRGNIITVAS